MISRYSVWLNDVSLQEIDPNIYVSDISYQAVSLSRETGRLAALDGQYSGRRDYIASNKISVAFMVREYNTQRRQEVVQNVISWASNGGWLKTSDRVGQKVYVKATRLPGVLSAMRWTDDLSVEFTAFDYPFWVDEYPQTVTLAQGETGQLFCPGVRRAFVEAEITAEAPLTSVQIDCGETSMILSNLSVSDGDVIKVAYSDEHHILDVSTGNLSLLNKRTSASDDDLIAEPGTNDISFTASGNATCEISVRGVWI